MQGIFFILLLLSIIILLLININAIQITSVSTITGGINICFYMFVSLLVTVVLYV